MCFFIVKSKSDFRYPAFSWYQFKMNSKKIFQFYSQNFIFTLPFCWINSLVTNLNLSAKISEMIRKSTTKAGVHIPQSSSPGV